MQPRIPIDSAQIETLCRRYHVQRLGVFGSVLREDFGPQSDVDVLVEFEEGHRPGLAFFDMQQELGTILGRPVDLVERKALRNPYRRHGILKTNQTLYAAP